MARYMDSPEPEPLTDREIDDFRFALAEDEDIHLPQASFPDEF